MSITVDTINLRFNVKVDLDANTVGTVLFVFVF